MSTKDEAMTVSPNGQQNDVSRRFYSMGLFEFEAFKVNGITHYVKRVPGGWILQSQRHCYVFCTIQRRVPKWRLTPRALRSAHRMKLKLLTTVCPAFGNTLLCVWCGFIALTFD